MEAVLRNVTCHVGRRAGCCFRGVSLTMPAFFHLRQRPSGIPQKLCYRPVVKHVSILRGVFLSCHS
jgi:hypothetical protein